MKTLVLCFSLLFAGGALAQTDSANIEAFYVGGLYVGSYDRHAELGNEFDVRGGAQISMPMLWGKAVTRLVYNQPGVSFAQFWTEQGRFSLGYMPRPIAVIEPNPVSADAHFMPPAFNVIPGAATGITYTVIRDTITEISREPAAGETEYDEFGNAVSGDTTTVVQEFVMGVYRSEVSRSIEFNAGAMLKDSLKTIRFAAYANRHEIGLSFLVEWPGIGKLMAFHNDSTVTSLFGTVNGPEGFEPFVSLVFREHGKSCHEFGITKKYTMPHGAMLLAGVGYALPDKFLKIYLQVYIQ